MKIGIEINQLLYCCLQGRNTVIDHQAMVAIRVKTTAVEFKLFQLEIYKECLQMIITFIVLCPLRYLNTITINSEIKLVVVRKYCNF